MTNIDRTDRFQMFRAARLGAIAGRLGFTVTERRVDARIGEDFADEYPEYSQGSDEYIVFSDAWATAWERARCDYGLAPAHLTAPAWKARH